jgi:hypothetical protein
MKKTSSALMFLALILVASSAFAASAPKNALPLPIGGNFIDTTGGIGSFAGTFYLQQFAVQNNALVGTGILTGTLTDSTGKTVGSVWKQVSLPVSFPSGAGALRAASAALGSIGVSATCDILHLDLGPLTLNLLGLNVNLSEVVLDITASTGAGNLLGNLLCAVTNLLNGVGTLVDIANLLNQILQILIGALG